MLAKATLFGGTAVSLFLAPTFVDALERRAEEGETRTRTIEASREMTIVDMVISFNGEEIPADQLGDVEATTTDSYRAVVVDAFEAVREGRATKFTRTYRELAGASAMEGGMMAMMGGGDMSSDLVSGLEGEDVIFTWDAEAEEYTPRFPEESTADEDLLEDLVGDLEFAELLPRGSVEVGSEWDVDLDFFESMIEPGGQLHLLPEDADMAEMADMERSMDEADVDPVYEGTFRAKLAGYDEVDGTRLARIELTFELEMSLDLSGALDPMTQESPMGEITITPVELVIERTAEGTGTLVWDARKGRLVSFALEADVTETNTSTVEVDFGEVMEQYQEITQEGSIEVSYTIE